jgi:hypothetical protein
VRSSGGGGCISAAIRGRCRCGGAGIGTGIEVSLGVRVEGGLMLVGLFEYELIEFWVVVC